MQLNLILSNLQVFFFLKWYQYSAVSGKLHHATTSSTIKSNYSLLCCNFSKVRIFHYIMDDTFPSEITANDDMLPLDCISRAMMAN